MSAIETAKTILENGAQRGVKTRQPEVDQMAVIVSNHTPYVIWRVGGGLVGACKSLADATSIMDDLRRSFPDREYICRDVDGDLCAASHHDGQIPNDAPMCAPGEA